MNSGFPAFRVGDLSKRLGGELIGDPAVLVCGPGMPEQPDSSRIVYANDPASAALLADGRFAAVITSQPSGGTIAPLIIHPEPRAAFLACLELFDTTETPPAPGVRPGASVDPSAVLGVGVVVLEGASIGSGARIGSGALVACGARIGRDVVIGADCRIGENAVIGDRVLLGDRVVVHQGAVIGSRGFGFAKQPDGSWRALPQLGTVRIGDDVEIGANTTIDRATAGETLIGAGTKIDNLVQIAHNVIVGRDVLIAAQCGIAGSARIGDRCVLAGQVGIADHCIVEDDVVIGAKSGVTTTRLLAGRHYFGSPARELGEMKRMLAALRRLVKKTEGD